MLRQDADPANLQPTDFICDFCGSHWSEDRPMVEGHQGSLICGRCLTVAFSQVLLQHAGERPGTLGEHQSETCTMCLEADRPEDHWRSPVRSEALICKRCIKMSATQLERDDDIAWERPTHQTHGGSQTRD